MFSDEIYKGYGFNDQQITEVRELWDKVGRHFGLIPSDFIGQMVTDAEFDMEDIWKKTKNTHTVFIALCQYLEHLMTYRGITYN